ncbi:MAG TPA: BlaI/MecI/CopY family transcriptional regulator [Terracidiphilus sp.]
MTSPTPKSGFTPLELRIMQVIWKLGGSSVTAVQAELDPPLAYTTVQTVLNILERKGKLRRELQGRAYVYSARVTEDNALGQSLRDLIDRMFGGSSEELVMSLLKNRHIDAQRLEKLTRQFKTGDTE